MSMYAMIRCGNAYCDARPGRAGRFASFGVNVGTSRKDSELVAAQCSLLLFLLRDQRERSTIMEAPRCTCLSHLFSPLVPRSTARPTHSLGAGRVLALSLASTAGAGKLADSCFTALATRRCLSGLVDTPREHLSKRRAEHPRSRRQPHAALAGARVCQARARGGGGRAQRAHRARRERMRSCRPAVSRLCRPAACPAWTRRASCSGASSSGFAPSATRNGRGRALSHSRAVMCREPTALARTRRQPTARTW
jgi:hypothetical protein